MILDPPGTERVAIGTNAAHFVQIHTVPVMHPPSISCTFTAWLVIIITNHEVTTHGREVRYITITVWYFPIVLYMGRVRGKRKKFYDGA